MAENQIIEAARSSLEKEVKDAGDDLKSFPRLPDGRIDPEVKKTDDYKVKKAKYDKAFEALRKFNSKYRPVRML